jgi:hypothetical protein
LIRAGRQGSASFLKKRSKKLLSIGVGAKLASEAREAITCWLRRPLLDEVFLLLFFQKKKCFPPTAVPT